MKGEPRGAPPPYIGYKVTKYQMCFPSLQLVSDWSASVAVKKCGGGGIFCCCCFLTVNNCRKLTLKEPTSCKFNTKWPMTDCHSIKEQSNEIINLRFFLLLPKLYPQVTIFLILVENWLRKTPLPTQNMSITQWPRSCLPSTFCVCVCVGGGNTFPPPLAYLWSSAKCMSSSSDHFDTDEQLFTQTTFTQ